MPKNKKQPSLFELLEYEKEDQRNRKAFGRKISFSDSDFDLYETPRFATLALLKREKFVGNILEPACGNGAISKVLIEKGYKVISRDKIARGFGEQKDFFEDTEMYDNTVSNPPYKFATEFVYHAIKHTRRKVAMLLRFGFLETKTRKDFLFDNKKLPTYFSKLYVFSERLHINGGSMVLYHWYVWDKEFKGTPTIHWI